MEVAPPCGQQQRQCHWGTLHSMIRKKAWWRNSVAQQGPAPEETQGPRRTRDGDAVQNRNMPRRKLQDHLWKKERRRGAEEKAKGRGLKVQELKYRNGAT